MILIKPYHFSTLKENHKSQADDFPFYIYNCSYPKDLQSFPIHWHEELEIGIVEQGIGIYRIEQQTYILKEGDILFIPPKILHAGETKKEGNKQLFFQTKSFLFPFQLLLNSSADNRVDSFIQPLEIGQFTFPFTIQPMESGYMEIKKTLYELDFVKSNQLIAYELELKSLLFHLFYLLHANHHIKKVSASNIQVRKSEKIRIVLQYITEHISEDLSIELLAKLIGYSPCHFMNQFKQYTKTSCIQYINDYRLQLACAYLLESNFSIMEIALLIGYNNISYFNRSFKKCYQMSPKEYRNQHLSDLLL